MRYLDTTLPRLTSRKCYKCASFMILSEQHVETMEGQYGPITTSTYICSNEECHAETEKDIVKMKKQKVEKDLANQKRLDRISESRKQAKKNKQKV